MSVIEYENDNIRIRYLDGFRRGPRFPRELDGNEAYVKVPGRRISAAAYHHSAGGFYRGITAVEKLASYCTAAPTYKVDDAGEPVLNSKGHRIVVGGGRGWPGIPYTYVIPAYPDLEDGRLVIYKIWHDDWITWHPGGIYNHHAVGVVDAGWYASRHDLLSGKDSSARDRPTVEAMTAADELADYLMVRHGLRMGPDTLKCHAELGKPACPGSFLENWIREKRGEDAIFDPTPGYEDPRPLTTEREVQEALVELGYNPGTVDGKMGPYTQNAIKAFQRVERLRPDGIFGPFTRQAMRLALARGK